MNAHPLLWAALACATAVPLVIPLAFAWFFSRPTEAIERANPRFLRWFIGSAAIALALYVAAAVLAAVVVLQ